MTMPSETVARSRIPLRARAETSATAVAIWNGFDGSRTARALANLALLTWRSA